MAFFRPNKLDIMVFLVIIFGWMMLEIHLPEGVIAKVIHPPTQAIAKPLMNQLRHHQNWRDWQSRMAGYELPQDIRTQLEAGSTDWETMKIAIDIIAGRLKPMDDIDAYGEEEYYATFAEAWETGLGDCDEYALLWYFMLREVGMDVAFVDLHLYGSPSLGHAVTMVKADDGKVYVLDVSNAEHGWPKPVSLSIWTSVNSPTMLFASTGTKTFRFETWLNN